MKKLLYTIILTTLFSCSITKDSQKEKRDITSNEIIETTEKRKGDTVTFTIPRITYKDTVITTVSRQGTILKTYFDKEGNVSKAYCISSEIELLRLEMRSLRDESKLKQKDTETKTTPELIYIILGVVLIVVIFKR